MILFSYSRPIRSEEMPVTAGVTITATGLGLVSTSSGTVNPPTGASTEAFAGFSLGVNQNLIDIPTKVSLTATTPASAALAQITLPTAPVAGTLRIQSNTDNVVLAAGTPSTSTASNNYSLSGVTVSVDYLRAGQTFNISYRYAVSAVQSRALVGNEPAGGLPSTYTGTIGVMRAGTLYTLEYDTTVDWANTQPSTVRLSLVTGRISSTGGGATGPFVPNFQLKAVPAAGGFNQAALGFYFSA